jgi:hypothetical protein
VARDRAGLLASRERAVRRRRGRGWFYRRGPLLGQNWVGLAVGLFSSVVKQRQRKITRRRSDVCRGGAFCPTRR